MSTSQCHTASHWDDESFYRYTGGRWLYNEKKQMADRSVKFNMTELVRAAAISQGCDISSCVKVEKLPEGDHNKVFLITLHDGRQVVAKVPNRNAGLPFFTTASEVATMDFGRKVAGLPIPKVYDWNPHTSNNDVGAEYIIMEKAKGVLLSSKWPSMKNDEKINLIKSVILLEKSLLAHHFHHIGSLYHKQDLARHHNMFLDTSYCDFIIGPTTERKFIHDGRRAVYTDKGPWNSALDYNLASSRRERECIVRGLRFPRPEGIFGGPGGYEPTAKNKLDVLDDFEKVAAYLLPKDTSVHIPVLWHGDLHDNNIFVDPDDPSKILSIIDWQATYIAPLFQQARTPGFLDFAGPQPSIGLTALPPLPDDFESLSTAEKEEAKKLQSKQSLYKIYEIHSGRENMPVFKALQHSEILGSQIISLISQVFNDGEPIIKGQIMQLSFEWKKLVGPDGLPCPLQFTEADIAAQEFDQQRWEEGVQLKGDVLEALGGTEHGWDGWSSHEDYDALTKKLAIVKEQFMECMASNEAEREAWENAWPYRDD
ncbi:phosphotransferase enzyme family protein [Nannizzia gypsea CBS 118893]|uniref:Altered inheritance of mitochondria protein 9, mitochondrial n=1 Tax=Arthroderma gypseum (strain ATCC MYA-4604 / CBS 118893) TaxID=535722 RepID=E5QZV8_ARTGP|nr:phosphotransferase enzyme family protein [Nannizzia gypsea CBS 118893]EFQ97421.1 phosphotransferase enzyme family protein [Nannizzia gypsea CBS 118893]